jgi:hypothetical protein
MSGTIIGIIGIIGITGITGIIELADKIASNMMTVFGSFGVRARAKFLPRFAEFISDWRSEVC